MEVDRETVVQEDELQQSRRVTRKAPLDWIAAE